MLALEELLHPIDAIELSGKDLRYDPVIDNIREARSEEDDSLPVGEWGRQTKRADYRLVASLTSDTLLKRTKDLWIAVWFGEASIQIEGYDALEPILRFLLELQRTFWLSVFPAVEEGDLSLRAAPLHWGFDRYAAIIHELPITENGIAYAAYKAVRSGTAVIHNEELLTTEKLAEFVTVTGSSFYSDVAGKLKLARAAMEELYLFCDEYYRDESPSFVRLRATLEEIHNISIQLCRATEVMDPDLDGTPYVEIASEPQSTSQQAPDLLPVHSPTLQTDSSPPNGSLESWEDAMQQLGRCATYMLEQRPASSATYLLILALQHDQDNEQECSPSSDMRLMLKRASEAGSWDVLLHQAIRSMMHASGKCWLDPYRYIWQAAKEIGAAQLQTLALMQVRTLLHDNAAIPLAVFPDDTPVANPETRQWIEKEVNPQEPVHAISEQTTHISLAPLPVEKVDDSFAAARELAERGEITQAARMLMEDPSVGRSGRANFMHRLEISRLCMQAGLTTPAASMLRQLLVEVDRHGLDRWEDPDRIGELFIMLLEVLANEEAETERQIVYARLCQTHPALALGIQT